MDLETDDDPPQVINRGTLLTSREKQWAESRAQMLQILGDAERAKAEARAARTEARALREHIIVSSTESRKFNFRKIATIFTAVLLSATVVKIAYVGYTSAREAPAAPSPVIHRTPREPVHVSATPKAPAPGDQQFKMSMARLQDAFDSLPEDEPEIVREVNQKHPGGPRPCPLEWINGEAALSLDGDVLHIPPSLMEAVTQCADAVEKFRAEREWIRQAEEPAAH